MALHPGTRLGPYEVLAPLGAGGMGEVYRARDPRLGRDVAIKVLPAAYSADPDRLARFKQEARAASKLDHPNILVIHDIGLHEGAPYVVSELLEGETLRERLASAPIPLRKAVSTRSRSSRGLRPPTARGSSTATSSPRTYSSPTRGGSRSSTSGSPRRRPQTEV